MATKDVSFRSHNMSQRFTWKRRSVSEFETKIVEKCSRSSFPCFPRQQNSALSTLSSQFDYISYFASTRRWIAPGAVLTTFEAAGAAYSCNVKRTANSFGGGLPLRWRKAYKSLKLAGSVTSDRGTQKPVSA